MTFHPLSPSTLGLELLRSLREHVRPLLAYHLFFTLLASSLLLPAIAWTLTGLLARFDRPVVTNAELLSLLLSPAGLLWSWRPSPWCFSSCTCSRPG